MKYNYQGCIVWFGGFCVDANWTLTETFLMLFWKRLKPLSVPLLYLYLHKPSFSVWRKDYYFNKLANEK